MPWPIEVSPHASRRMPTRRFSETDLRGMLEEPVSIVPDVCPGRGHHRHRLHSYRIMTVPYLEISFRHGRPFAAYIHCSSPRPSAITLDLGHGLILDQADDGSVIGIEITDPRQADSTFISTVLGRHGIAISAADLAPLAA